MCLVLFNCADSSVLMLYPCWVLIKCTTFGESVPYIFEEFEQHKLYDKYGRVGFKDGFIQ